MEFNGLSRVSLQDALLNRLSRIASLRKESKQYRARLSDTRSELALLTHELKIIEEQLERVLAMPKIPETPAVKETKVVEIRRKTA